MSDPVCETCRWWAADTAEEGCCRRHAPIAASGAVQPWPVTVLNDWCGDWVEGPPPLTGGKE